MLNLNFCVEALRISAQSNTLKSYLISTFPLQPISSGVLSLICGLNRSSARQNSAVVYTITDYFA